MPTRENNAMHREVNDAVPVQTERSAAIRTVMTRDAHRKTTHFHGSEEPPKYPINYKRYPREKTTKHRKSSSQSKICRESTATSKAGKRISVKQPMRDRSITPNIPWTEGPSLDPYPSDIRRDFHYSFDMSPDFLVIRVL